jgi:enterochelin esterase-like enzyme
MKKRLETLVFVALVGVLLPALPQAVAQDDPPRYLEARDVPHGRVLEHDYTSMSLGSERRLFIYTPPGYDAGAERYPVLYLLHGAGGDESTWTERGQAHVILDNLMAEGRLDPLVVVMPYGYAFRREPGAGRGNAEENRRQREGFERDLLEDVIPLVESTYRVHADREHRAIAGLSLGGAQALGIGLTHTDVFSRVAGFSSALGAANVDFQALLSESAELINSRLHLLWVGCGTEDTLFDSNMRFSSLLGENRVNHTLRVTDGAHTMAVWQRYLHEVAPLLF